MNPMNQHNVTGPESPNREALRVQAHREELTGRIARAMPEDGLTETLEGLILRRYSAISEPVYAVSQPSLCVIAQGSKEIYLGERRYRYDPFHYLLVTAELPVVGQYLDASEERPFLGLILTLDAALVSSVIAEAGHAAPQNGTSIRALDVSPLSAILLGAVVRLVRLLDAPGDAPILAPLIKREIVYRLLQGAQSGRLGHIALLNGSSRRIALSVKWIRENFDQPLQIERLAEELGMSPSSFYHHFKAVTDMTPLQFQKQLQLQEARRLMLSEELDAATAGYRVGYKDASHFNREYKRLFGRPPVRDVERLRKAARPAR
jgi:AraC-like DNA-binding protein